MSNDSLVAWLTSPAPPLYALLMGCAVLAVRFWPVWKQRLTEARTADDAIVGNQWKRFQDEIERLAQRVERLERDVEECHRDRDEERARRVQLEAIMIGRGKADQEAAAIIAAERLGEDRRTKK